ncbi:MAG: spore cortex biosynthesis protein YabQ [Erysipelotrichaceae bacterium]
MILANQIQAILYHLMMGICYGLSYSFFMYITLAYHRKLGKAILEIIFHCLYTILMFYGLYQINGGITNGYLIIIFIIGVWIFYQFYFSMMQRCYRIISRLLYPITHSLKQLKKRFFAYLKKSLSHIKNKSEISKS